MFNLRDFIKRGLLDAVGKMADYQVILNATGWYEKNVLLEEDLAEINALIEAQYVEEVPEVEVMEENLPESECEVEVMEENLPESE